MLEEVVAIGYGAVPKRDLTGAVSSLKSEDLLKTNPVSINQGLQGKLAGVNVSQSDGAPGAGVNIQIRGANSFTTSTEPLYIVDGMPYSVGEAPATDYGTKSKNNPLSTISPQDIQSIEVLKMLLLRQFTGLVLLMAWLSLLLSPVRKEKRRYNSVPISVLLSL